MVKVHAQAARAEDMKKDGETLADMLIREWSTKKYRQNIDLDGWIPRNVALARKFYLDDEMSAFMADLAYASMPGWDKRHELRGTSQSHGRRVFNWVDNLRVMARLPHDLTWIEYDMKLRAKRSHEAYNAQLAAYNGPQRCGWLIARLPNKDLEDNDGKLYSVGDGEYFMAIPCASQSTSGMNGTGELLDMPNAGPYGYVWTSGKDPLPNTEWLEKTEYVISRGLTGMQDYRSPHVSLVKPAYVMSNPGLLKIVKKMNVGALLTEHGGDLRYLWAFLATINDLPVLKTHVKPDRGHMVRGNYRRFSEHTVISLKIPARTSLSAVARRALRASRRRAHQVRGHWRVDWRAAPAALCDHVWVGGDGDAACRLCHGRKTWVREHQRGDASVGFVLHDYAVQRGD